MTTGAIINYCALASWARASGLSTNFEARSKKIASICRDLGVDVILGQEIVTYANARMISRHMGWGGDIVDNDNPNKNDSCVLHGDGGVANGIIWNPKLIRAINTGQIVTAGSINRKSTHGRFYIGDEKCGLATFHHEYRPKGPNNDPYYDRIRYRQQKAICDQLVKSGQSWLTDGDANHAIDDKPDAVGNPARAHGMVDVNTRNIMRGFATKDIKQIGKPRKINLGNATDHPMFLHEFEVPA